MSSDPQLVDDTTPAVQYAPGWIWDQLVDEVDHTRHGAAISGLTASLGFSGTGIQVVGTLGASDSNGQPRTTYTIDGAVVGSFNAPVTPSGQTHYNVTFFSKLDLSPGDHEIVITNLDGTSPNHFWLDYFLIYKSPPPNNGPSITTTPPPHSITTTTTSHSFSSTLTKPPPDPSPSSTVTSTSSSTSSSSSPVSASASNSISTSSSAAISGSTTSSASSASSNGTIYPAPLQVSQTISGSGSSAVNTTTPLATVEANVSQQKGHTDVGAIAGGVAGGLALFVLLAFVFLWRRRYRRAREEIVPFGSVLPRDRYDFSSQPSRPNGHGAKVPEMYFNQAAFASVHTPNGSVSESSYRASLPADTALVYAQYSRPDLAMGTSPDTPNQGLTSRGADGRLGTTKAQDSTIYESSSPPTSSTTHLVPSRRQPASPQSDAHSPVTPASTTSLLLHTEVAHTPWYSPPQAQSRAQSLLRAFSSRIGRGSSNAGSVVQDVDSGLRTYNEAALPPPYTPD
ncbi:hypothetical protein C8T65DRAFT_236271 [Cerioporus squamosus]|nr:hypothetical protein C8T65DRAFT_236271 [Cerioporus squamosus]